MITTFAPLTYNNAFGIPDDILQEIIDTIKKYPDITAAKIFGSRAKGNYQRYSDIDIAIFADTPDSLASTVWGDLDEIYMIYEVDVLHYEHTSNALIKEHIDRVGIRIL